MKCCYYLLQKKGKKKQQGAAQRDIDDEDEDFQPVDVDLTLVTNTLASLQVRPIS